MCCGNYKVLKPWERHRVETPGLFSEEILNFCIECHQQETEDLKMGLSESSSSFCQISDSLRNIPEPTTWSPIMQEDENQCFFQSCNPITQRPSWYRQKLPNANWLLVLSLPLVRHADENRKQYITNYSWVPPVRRWDTAIMILLNLNHPKQAESNPLQAVQELPYS